MTFIIDTLKFIKLCFFHSVKKRFALICTYEPWPLLLCAGWGIIIIVVLWLLRVYAGLSLKEQHIVDIVLVLMLARCLYTISNQYWLYMKARGHRKSVKLCEVFVGIICSSCLFVFLYTLYLFGLVDYESSPEEYQRKLIKLDKVRQENFRLEDTIMRNQYMIETLPSCNAENKGRTGTAQCIYIQLSNRELSAINNEEMLGDLIKTYAKDEWIINAKWFENGEVSFGIAPVYTEHTIQRIEIKNSKTGHEYFDEYNVSNFTIDGVISTDYLTKIIQSRNIFLEGYIRGDDEIKADARRYVGLLLFVSQAIKDALPWDFEKSITPVDDTSKLIQNIVVSIAFLALLFWGHYVLPMSSKTSAFLN